MHNKCFDNDIYEDEIVVNDITVQGIAEVEVDNDILILKNIAVYAIGGDVKGEIGVKNIMAWVKNVIIKAKEEGFSELRLKGKRVQNSSSANPGNIIDMRFEL